MHQKPIIRRCCCWAGNDSMPFSLAFLSSLLFCIGSRLSKILTKAITSAVARNVWQNLRGPDVFVLCLIVWYVTLGGYGQPWHEPASVVLLVGYDVAIAGLLVYYKQSQGSCEEQEAGGNTNSEMESSTESLDYMGMSTH